LLAVKFKKWNSSVFRNQDRKLADIESKVHRLEAEGERRHLVDSEVEELGRLNYNNMEAKVKTHLVSVR
jgi:hypothetical protein